MTCWVSVDMSRHVSSSHPDMLPRGDEGVREPGARATECVDEASVFCGRQRLAADRRGRCRVALVKQHLGQAIAAGFRGGALGG